MNSTKKNKLASWFYIFFISFFILFLISIISALPQNPLSLKKKNDVIISQILPQGWGFFSKSPREEYLSVYGANSELSPNWPNMKMSNLFGINRFGRAQGTEIGLFFGELQEEDFKKCSKTINECIEEMKEIKPVEIINYTPKKTLCGEQYITLHEPMPWAWSSSEKRNYKSSKLAKVELKCSGK